MLEFLKLNRLQLCSLSVTADQWYKAYGLQRYNGPVSADHRFTGQKQDGSGLQYFNARYYDPQIGLFVSPDTIVPDAGNVFDYNRFMYVRGRGLRQSPPSESLQRSFSGDISLLAKGLRQTIDYIMYCHYI